jgi:hypothetical protein
VTRAASRSSPGDSVIELCGGEVIIGSDCRMNQGIAIQDLEAWASWALAQADQLDPINARSSRTLDAVEK